MDTSSPYSGFQQIYAQLSQEEKNARLLKAAQKGQSELVGILIVSGANVKARTKDNDRMTPFLCAVQAGHNQCTSLLLQHNPGSFYDLDGNGDNALTIALWYGRKKIFYSLLNLPGQYISSEMLSNALFAAAINDLPEEAQMLINKGADINSIHPKDGTTPLMAAETFESFEMIHFLRRIAGADVASKKPTPKIYPILSFPSCPTFVPPCYQPIISQETNNEKVDTEQSLCNGFKDFSLCHNIDLKPSAPPLSDLFPGIEPKKNKRKAPSDLDESNRKIKKNRVLCSSDFLSEFCFNEKVAEKVLRKGIAALTLNENDTSLGDTAVAVLPPPVIFIAEQRAPKRKAQSYLTRDNDKAKKPKL